jgi:hypothetical protein
MNEKRKEMGEPEMVSLDRIFIGFLFGVGAVSSLWFMSSLLYVILK